MGSKSSRFSVFECTLYFFIILKIHWALPYAILDAQFPKVAPTPGIIQISILCMRVDNKTVSLSLLIALSISFTAALASCGAKLARPANRVG